MMDDGQAIRDAETLPPKGGRKGDGGTYLVVADDSEEFKPALLYACRAARQNRGRLGLLHITEDQDFQHWGSVEERMKKELREQAEKYLWTIAKSANDLDGVMPSFYIAQGDAREALVETINNDSHIVQLILGGGTGHNPGPLVTFCTGKGLDRMRVPVVIVPGHLKDF